MTSPVNLWKLRKIVAGAGVPLLEWWHAQPEYIALVAAKTNAWTGMLHQKVLTAPGAGNRPGYTTGGMAPGVDTVDFVAANTTILTGAAGILSGKTGMTAFMVLKNLSYALGIQMEYSPSFAVNAGSFLLATGAGIGAMGNAITGANALPDWWGMTAAGATQGVFAFPQTLGAGAGNCAQPIEINNVAQAGATTSAGAASSPYGNFNLNIGGRETGVGGFFATMSVSDIVITDGSATAAQRLTIYSALAELAGNP